MSAAREFSATGMAVRTAAILFVFVIVFTALLSAAYLWTKPAIEASATEEKMKLIDEVLPRRDYDNALLDDTLDLPATPELGLSEASTLYRARLAGQPLALVFEAVAPDGYSGKIRLVLAIRADGRVSGVRVIREELLKTLAQHGVGLINPAQGELFQPGRHEAVMQMAQDGIESGHIVQTFQAGYTLGAERVLRPAKVAVAP